MRTITLKIYNDLLDSFYYMGRLFVITKNRELRYITQGQLFDKYIKKYKNPENKILRSILFDNKSLATEKDYFDNANYQVLFDNLWTKFSAEKFEILIEKQDLIFLCEAPEKEPLDFIIYGKRVLVANRDGIYECLLQIDVGVTKVERPFSRVFDSKSISLNPRIGEILISTKVDGLFRASLYDPSQNIRVHDNAIQKKSTKTGWAQFNFVNYLDFDEVKLLVNETIIDNNSSLANSLKEDDGILENIRISGFAKREKDINASLPSKIRSEIIFSFNSMQYCFFITQGGSILYCRISTETNSLDAIKKFEIKIDIKGLGRPLSAFALKGGTVFEFFNKVIFIRDNKEVNISNVESKQIRSFGHSIRYQNIISILTDEHLEIHSIHPYKM